MILIAAGEGTDHQGTATMNITVTTQARSAGSGGDRGGRESATPEAAMTDL